MIKREIEAVVRKYAAEYPSVTVMGPRQSGKSMLVRALFPKHAYANLEDRETREILCAETSSRTWSSWRC